MKHSVKAVKQHWNKTSMSSQSGLPKQSQAFSRGGIVNGLGLNQHSQSDHFRDEWWPPVGFGLQGKLRGG